MKISTNDYKEDPDFKKFMVGWRCFHDELKLLVRIELYKHILKNNVKEEQITQ